MTAPSQSWVAVDWGTSNLRASLLRGRNVLAEAMSADGIAALPPDGHRPALQRLLNEIGAPVGAPVLMSGMVGSTRGWHETPYLGCPAGLKDLALALHPLPQPLAGELGSGGVYIVPGLMIESRVHGFDVMRGEETQIIGALALLGKAYGREALIALPGTHAKWADIAEGRVIGFATYMTGELRRILLSHSILKPSADGSMASQFDKGAFLKGVDHARATPALSRALFAARSEALAGRLSPSAVPSFLSGILIGHEVSAAAVPEGTTVFLVAARGLEESYGLAFSAFEITHEKIDGAAAAREGLYLIGCAAGLIEEET